MCLWYLSEGRIVWSKKRKKQNQQRLFALSQYCCCLREEFIVIIKDDGNTLSWLEKFWVKLKHHHHLYVCLGLGDAAFPVLHRFLRKPADGSLPLCFDVPPSRLKLLHHPSMGGYRFLYTPNHGKTTNVLQSRVFVLFWLCVVFLTRAVCEWWAELRSSERFQQNRRAPEGPSHSGGQHRNCCAGGANTK